MMGLFCTIYAVLSKWGKTDCRRSGLPNMLLETWMQKGEEIKVQVNEEVRFQDADSASGLKTYVGKIAACSEEGIYLRTLNDCRFILFDHIAVLKLLKDQKLQTEADFETVYMLRRKVDIYQNGVLIAQGAEIQLNESDFILAGGKCYDKMNVDVYAKGNE